MARKPVLKAVDGPVADRFIAYYRLLPGLDGQAGPLGLGLEAQQEAVARHVQGIGGRIIGAFHEIESGKRDGNRPQLRAAISACRAQRTALVIAGAGGAGFSIVVSLLEEGASEVVFHDRSPAAHDALQAKLSASFPGRSRIGNGSPEGCDVVINATSSGLRPTDPLPVDPGLLRPNMTVADVITDPVPTALLAEAERIGCRTRDGTHMLEGQISLLFGFMLHKESAP